MKNIFALSLIISFLQNAGAQPTTFLKNESWGSVWSREEEEEDEKRPDAGWIQQYYEMKKSADGKMVRLPFEKIREQESNASLRDNLLFNADELGPYNIGGRTRSILIDRSNDQHVIAGSVSGGLFSSFDEGATWTVINDEMTALSISSLTQDFFNNNLIYAGTGEGWGNADGVIGNGVYRSEDGGTTFNQLPSTDGSDFNYIFDVATSPADSNSLYVATGTGSLFRSFNKGDSLKLVFDAPNSISDIEMTPAGGVWIGVYYQGLYYSPSGDSGTFELRINGITNNIRRVEFAIAKSDTTVLYAAIEKQSADGFSGIYKTTDFGQNWNAVANPSDFGFATNQTWYDMCIAIKSDDTNFVVLGANALMYTYNGGTQWFECLNIHSDHHSIVFHPENPEVFYEGNDGGVYRYTTNLLYNPNELNTGYRTIQYYAGAFYPSGMNILGGTQDNGTHKCNDGDGVFAEVHGGDGAYCAVNQQFADVAYAEIQNGIIARTFEGTLDVPGFTNILGELDGNNDNQIDEGAWFINPFDINLVNGDYLAFITTKRLWESFDGGSSWQPAMNQIGSTPYAIGISREFSPTVYVGGSAALFYRIDDAYDSQPGEEVNLSGKVPVSVTGDFIHCITVHPADNSVCYVSFSNASNNPRVWKVTAANTDNPVWTSISGDLPQGLPVNYIDVDPARPDEFFLAATDYGVYISDDGGLHWYKQNAFPNVYTEQVKVRPGDRRLFVFTHGRGAFTATLDSLNVGVPNTAPNSFYAEVFPNPVHDQLQIKTNESNLTVSIRDMNSREMMAPKLIHGNSTIDLSSLASGIYLMEIKSKDRILVRKVVKE